MPIAGPMLEEPSQLVEVAKCNLGEVNLKLMQANPISCQSQANASRDLYDLRGWSQGLAWLCACMWTLVAIFAIVSSTDLWGSLPWTDHCFVHHICSLVAQLSLVDHCFGCLFCQSVPTLATRHRSWFTLGTGSGKFLHWSSFSVMVVVGGHSQGWFLLTRLL